MTSLGALCGFLQVGWLALGGRASVGVLFGYGGPFTVGRLVIAIIIDSFDGVVRGWFLAHVFHEMLKALFALPAVRDLNSTPTVKIII